MAKDEWSWLWIIIVIAGIYFIVGQPFAILDTKTATLTGAGTVTDSLADCQASMVQTKLNYGSYTFPISECRRCPFADGQVPAQCRYACGTSCSAGVDCLYPPNCPTGCSQQCISYYQGPNGLVCGNSINNCNDISINYWDSNRQGCKPAVPLPAYITFMLGQDEVGTQAQIDAEAKFQRVCNGVGVAPAVDTNTTTVPLGVPFVCDRECTSTQAIDVDTCSCMDATSKGSGGIPWYVYLGIGVVALIVVFMIVRRPASGQVR